MHDSTLIHNTKAGICSPIKQISKSTIRKLLIAADKDKDDKLSLEDLTAFIQQHGIRSITSNVLKAMYNEVTGRRVVTQKYLQDKPITFDELVFCCIFV